MSKNLSLEMEFRFSLQENFLHCLNISRTNLETFVVSLLRFYLKFLIEILSGRCDTPTPPGPFAPSVAINIF